MKTILQINGNPVTLENVSRKSGEVHFSLNGKTYQFNGTKLPDGTTVLEEITPAGAKSVSGEVWSDGKGAKRVRFGSLEAKITEQKAGSSSAAAASAVSPVAPMPGAVRQIMVKVGDKVKKGDPVIIVEAMKLQLTLSAGGDGVVEAIPIKVGDMVAEGAELVKIKESK